MIETFVEITFESDEDFLKIKETLTRIGIPSQKYVIRNGIEEEVNKLFQSCHILHKRGKFYLVHFKELFALDGKKTDFSEDDIGRRNTIASLLEEWGLFKVVNPDMISSPRAPLSQIKILPFKEKPNWVLEAKYSIGRKRS